MNKGSYLIFLCLSSVFFSCSGLRQVADAKDRIPLQKKNLADLNGKYNNEPKPGKDSARTDLYWNIFDIGYNAKDSICYIEIKATGPDKLNIALWDNNQIVKSKIFKGKIRSDYFVFKRRYLIIPAILVNLFRNRRFRIGLLPNGNIITDYNQISFGSFYVILPYIEKRKYYGIEFERVN
jgi:hypothetical protein